MHIHNMNGSWCSERELFIARVCRFHVRQRGWFRHRGVPFGHMPIWGFLGSHSHMLAGIQKSNPGKSTRPPPRHESCRGKCLRRSGSSTWRNHEECGADGSPNNRSRVLCCRIGMQIGMQIVMQIVMQIEMQICVQNGIQMPRMKRGLPRGPFGSNRYPKILPNTHICRPHISHYLARGSC